MSALQFTGDHTAKIFQGVNRRRPIALNRGVQTDGPWPRVSIRSLNGDRHLITEIITERQL